MHGRTFVGTILVLLGAGFLLDNLEIIQFSASISIYWPVILIVIGANQLLTKGHSVISGTVLILAGLFFSLRNLGLLPVDIGSYFWPALLIITGLLVIFGRLRYNGVPMSKDDSLNHFVVFSGLESKCISKGFKGGRATALFGGIDLDFRDADLGKEGAVLELTAVFGGINIKVPDHWKVVVTGTPIFGGWENKTKTPADLAESQPTLSVRCFPLFGGIEIAN